MRRMLSLAIAAAVLQPAPATGQETAAPAPQALVQRLPRHLIERAERRERLYNLVSRVLQERAEVRDSVEVLARAYREAMEALDPESTRRRMRLQELEAAYTGAVLADDTTGIGVRIREGVALHRALAETAERAAERPDLQRRLEAIREAAAAALLDLDPDAAALFEEEDVIGSLVKRLACRPTAHGLARSGVP